MHRRIAKFLLLLALVGNLVPVALAICASPPHACCLRKSVRHCHESQIVASEQLALRGGDCCNHDCCRAVTKVRWAHAPSQARTFYVRSVANRQNPRDPDFLDPGVLGLQLSRAPPHSSIA
jgi:hypothetical protein